MRGFRDFVLRGNVVDLAVAVVVGTAFTAIVTAIVTDLINPLIGALFNADSLKNALVVHMPTTSGAASDLRFGAVLGAVINFVIVAAVVYFAFVLPLNAALKRAAARKGTGASGSPAPTGSSETELLIQIRDLLAAQTGTDGRGTPHAGGGSHRAPLEEA